MDGLTTLANASTTNLSLTGNLWLNGNATTTSTGNIQGQGSLTMLGTGTSTYSGGLQGTALNITSATASSTFANGIILSKGCFLMPDGTCAGAGGSSTINSGTTGQLSYYAGSGTTLTATSSLFIHSNQNIGIGTTTPNWLLQAAGTRPFFTLSDTGAAANNKHWFLSSQGGNFYVGTSSDAYATTSISVFTINSNGFIGIGTTSPSSKFSVAGSSYFGTGTNDILTIHTGLVNYPISATTTIPASVNAWSVGTTTNIGNYPILSVDGVNGRVGIGVANPSSQLTISKDIGGFIELIRTNTTNSATLQMQFTSIDTWLMGIDGSESNNPFRFGRSQFANFLIIDRTGDIGIGGDGTPDARLEITSYSSTGAAGDYFYISSDEAGNNNGDIFTIKQSNNIGISTTTPNWLLQIASTSPYLAITDTDSGTNLKHWLISNQSGNLYFATSTDSYATSTSNLLNLISSNYSVGIGTSTPAEQLSVSGRLFVGGTGTSTIQNNLYVMGTLRSTVSYVGDLIFSNNFKFIETPPNAKIQSLFLQNQTGENILKINEKGQVVVREIEAERGKFRNNLQTENLQIGSPQNRTGITIYDKDTGKPYCIEIIKGQMINKEGECK